MKTEETVLEAHALGRHASEHPEDKAFWEAVCPVCGTVAKLQPWMVAAVQHYTRGCTIEQLTATVATPLEGMKPGEMLERIMAERELDRRRSL